MAITKYHKIKEPLIDQIIGAISDVVTFGPGFWFALAAYGIMVLVAWKGKKELGGIFKPLIAIG